MCHAYKEKRKTTNDGRERTYNPRKKSEQLGEKKAYKYLGILEADIIQPAEMKEKILKIYNSGEPENYSKSNYILETRSNGQSPGLFPT